METCAATTFVLDKEALPRLIELTRKTDATVILPMNESDLRPCVDTLTQVAAALGLKKLVLVLVRDL